MQGRRIVNPPFQLTDLLKIVKWLHEIVEIPSCAHSLGKPIRHIRRHRAINVNSPSKESYRESHLAIGINNRRDLARWREGNLSGRLSFGSLGSGFEIVCHDPQRIIPSSILVKL
jgi:hypothetical protein